MKTLFAESFMIFL